MKRIVSIGSATQDIFILYEGAETLHLHLQKKEYAFLLLEQGTKIDVPQLHYAAGGGATNTAVSFKRLGLDTDAFFKIGADSAGQFVYEKMLKEKVGIGNCIINPEASTALSFIIPSVEHDHVALCYRGANTTLIQEEFPFHALADFDYLFISPLSGRSSLLLPLIAKRAQELGIPVATNLSMFQILHETAVLISALAAIDILIVNAYEATHLMGRLLSQGEVVIEKEKKEHTDKPRLLSHFMRYGDTTLTLFDYYNEIFKRGPKIAIVTNGKEGVYIATKETIYFHSSLKTDVICSLGAGDAFSAAFVGSIALGKEIEQAILYGLINACSVLHFTDAQEGLLTSEELEQRSQSLGTGKLQKFSR